jgi:putative salt-induced outer membrane protein YdiY
MRAKPAVKFGWLWGKPKRADKIIAVEMRNRYFSRLLMKKPIATIVAAAGIMAAFAETSTNTSATGAVTPEKKNPWEQSVSAGLTLTSGNSDSLLATIKYLADKKNAVDEFSFDADAAYGKANDVQSVNTIHGFVQWNHLFSERLFSYARLEGLHDDISEIRYRVTLSGGAGYYFIKETNTTLAGEVGPGLITERLDDNTPYTFATLRLAERFEHKFAPGDRVWQTAELLPQVDRFQNYIFNLELGAEAALSKSLSLQVVLDDTYDSEPASGFKRNDVKLVSGVSYKF